MRKIFTKTFLGICLLGVLLTGGMLRAQISLTATAGTLSGTYTDLTSAFNAINAGTHQGAITINITTSYTEPGPAVLNSSGAGSAVYTSVLIQPSTDGVIVSGATATGRGLIELKGADNVTINGDNPNTGGTNRNLTIANTALNTVTLTSCIRVATAATVVLSADNITISNLILVGSATGRNASGNTSTTGSENTTFGIYVGGNGGTTATDAPTAITSVTTNSAPSGTTVNNFTASNNVIGAVARAIVFNGAATTVSTGVTVTNNIIGNAGTLTGVPPFTAPATTVYTKGIWLAGTNALTVTGNTLQNILSFVGTTITAIELNAAIGTGTVTISNNTITGVVNNATSAASGILISSCAANPTIASNTVSNVQGTVSSTVSGINITYTGTAATVEKNRVSTVYNRSTGGWTAYGIGLNGGNGITLRNNFVWDINAFVNNGALSQTFGFYGIRISSGTGHRVYHNSVHLSGAVLGVTSFTACAALNVTSTTNTGLDIRNNIFSNTITGMPASSSVTALLFVSGLSSASNITLNNNAYYEGTGTGAAIAQVGTTAGTGIYTAANFVPGAITPATNLRSYTSTLSAAGTNDNSSYASANAAPYVSATDLHLNLASAEIPNVEQKGDASVGVATDIDGDNRPSLATTLPDMGGDEVAVALCSAANGGTITPSSVNKCAGQTHTMVSVGPSTGTGISYQWKVATVSGGPYTNVTGGSGATTASYTTGALTPGTYYYVMQTTCAAGPLTGLSNQVTVTVTANPVVTATPSSATYCTPGPGVSIVAGGASTYAWSPAAGLSATTGANVVATPSASTTYTVTGTDAVGCTATATSAITVAPAVVAAATATPASICPNGTSQLITTGTVAGATYCQPTTSCTFPDIITNVTFSTINRTSTCDGASTAGYSSYALPNPVLNAGSTYALSVSTGGDIEGAAAWIDYNQDGVFSASEQLFNGFAGTNPATYSTPAVLIPLTAYNGQTRMRVRCTYNTNPNTLTDPACSNVTFGETEDYTVTIAGGVAPISYSWSPATFLNVTNNDTVTASAVTATTTYIATTTTGAGCTDTASVQLFVATSATVNPTVSTPLCEGVPVIASANATGGLPITYVWTPNVGTTSSVHVDSTLGSHSYTVNVTDACGNLASGTLNYTILANPVISVTPDTSAICGGNGPVSLSATGTPTFDWSPATGLSATTGATVDANPTVSQLYTVIGTDAAGCKDTVAAFVGVGPALTIGAMAAQDTLCFGDSTSLMITGGLPVGTYCQPTYTNGTSFGDWCSLVQLGNINNPTAGAAAPYYTYFPPSPTTTTTLTAGTTYTITLSAGTYTSNDLAAWIDYDQNGTLNDVGEKLGETDNLGAGPATTSFTFTVPVGAYNGVTRLRVREMDHGGTNDMDPCLNQSTFGEVEDYDVTIVGGLDRIVYAWDPSPSLTVLNNDTVMTLGITTTTTFTAHATSGVGCTDTATVTVALSTTPPTAQCTSLPITLQLDSTGIATISTIAVDSSSFDACGIDTMMLTTSTFTCGQVGANTTTLVVNNINGVSDSCTVSVTIEDNIAPSIICPPNQVIPQNLCAGGAIVSWPAPTIFENCTPIITSSDAPGDTLPFGSTTVVYTVADSAGQQDTCSFVVTVTFNVMNAGPTATPATICEGSSTVLNSGVTGGIAPLSFQWSNGAGNTDPVTVSPTTTTNYQVTVTDACGNVANGGITVTVNPLPVANFTAVDNQNGSITVTNSSSNATSYSWNFNPGSGTQSGATFTFTYGSAGSHNVTLIATNACGSDTITLPVNVTTAIGRNLGDLNSSVYPNPNRGEFFLQLDNMSGEHVKVSITDMRGVEVKATELDITGGTHREALDISQFSKGVYFVRVRTENGSKVHKITVQ